MQAQFSNVEYCWWKWWRWFQSNLFEVFLSFCARGRCRSSWGVVGGCCSPGPPSVFARCKAGKRFPKSPALSSGRDTAGEVTPFEKKKKSGCVKSVFQHERTINSLVKWLLHKSKSCFVVQWNYSIHCIDLCCFEAASWRLLVPFLTASLNVIFRGLSVGFGFFFFFFYQSVYIITHKGSLWVSFSRDSWGAQEERVRVW